ncbi:MAG: DUF547 domain-containing protein [Pseudomonadota bacterium]
MSNIFLAKKKTTPLFAIGSPVSILAATALGVALITPPLSPVFAQEKVGQESGEQTRTDANPFARFANHSTDSRAAINYDQVDDFIEAVSVRSRGRTKFRYAILRDAGGPYLDQFIDFLEARDPAIFSKDEQLAYWLNLHNLLVLSAITTDAPGKSLERFRGTPANPGAGWTKKRVTVAGVALSLADIEDKIILAHWPDATSLYGLYQGARGGPAYPPKSFTGTTVVTQLAEAAGTTINRRGTLSIKKDVLSVPAYFAWYGPTVFGDDEAGYRAHILDHADEKLAARVRATTQIKVKKFSYRLEDEIVRAQQPLNGSLNSGGGVTGS